MGWASGSYLAEEIWNEIKDVLPKEKKQFVARLLYDKFCDYDADDWENHNKSLWAIAYPDEWLEYVKELAEDEGKTCHEIIKEYGWE